MVTENCKKIEPIVVKLRWKQNIPLFFWTRCRLQHSELCECIRADSLQTVLQPIYVMTAKVCTQCDCFAYCGTCVSWSAMIKVQYTSSVFVRTLLDFTSRIQRLHFYYYCADVWKVLVHFVATTVAHVHRQPGHIRSSTVCVSQFSWRACLLGRSAVRAQPWLLQQLLGLFVACCVTA